jgi:hypothetical protein
MICNVLCGFLPAGDFVTCFPLCRAYWDKSFAYEYSDYAAAKKREAEENRINQERMRANSAAPFCSISPRKETFQPFPPWTGGLVSSKMQHASYGHSLSASRSSTPGLMSSKRRMKRGELSRPQSGFH